MNMRKITVIAIVILLCNLVTTSAFASYGDIGSDDDTVYSTWSSPNDWKIVMGAVSVYGDKSMAVLEGGQGAVMRYGASHEIGTDDIRTYDVDNAYVPMVYDVVTEINVDSSRFPSGLYLINIDEISTENSYNSGVEGWVLNALQDAYALLTGQSWIAVLPLDGLKERTSGYSIDTPNKYHKYINYTNDPLGSGVYFKLETYSSPQSGDHYADVTVKGDAYVQHVPSPNLLIYEEETKGNPRLMYDLIKEDIKKGKLDLDTNTSGFEILSSYPETGYIDTYEATVQIKCNLYYSS